MNTASEPRPMASAVQLVSITSNDDGTNTVRIRRADGSEIERILTDEQLAAAQERNPTVQTTEVEVLGRKVGRGKSDCAWCRYGKPAGIGAVAGLALASVMGQEPARGLIWGGIGGLLVGHLRG